MKRINHQEAYSLDGACTNQAEEYFSRLRRAEIGIHHPIAGAYLLRYAQESSWREDNRRISNGDQVSRVAALAMKRGKIAMLPLYIEFIDTVWIPEHSERYLKTRDVAALPYLPKLLPSPGSARVVAPIKALPRFGKAS